MAHTTLNSAFETLPPHFTLLDVKKTLKRYHRTIHPLDFVEMYRRLGLVGKIEHNTFRKLINS